MNRRLILVGGGGHCESVLDCVLSSNVYTDIAIIDKTDNVGNNVLGIPVIGNDNDLPLFFQRGYSYAFVSLGSIGAPLKRVRLFFELRRLGFDIPNIIDPSATVSRHAKLGAGIFVGKNSVVNAGTIVGNGVILNTASVVEHDCIIGNFAHIAPGAVLGGAVKVGENAHVGANSVVKQQVLIGTDAVIGMGSVVLGDVGERMMAYGNPCKEIKKL